MLSLCILFKFHLFIPPNPLSHTLCIPALLHKSIHDIEGNFFWYFVSVLIIFIEGNCTRQLILEMIALGNWYLKLPSYKLFQVCTLVTSLTHICAACDFLHLVELWFSVSRNFRPNWPLNWIRCLLLSVLVVIEGALQTVICISFQNGSIQCPTCKTIYGIKLGDQPPGFMDYYVLQRPLPSFPEHETIRIIYNIPPGIQVKMFKV